MRIIVRAVAALANAAWALGPAAAAVPCSSETFSVDGAALTVRLCDAGLPRGGEVQETMSVGTRPPIVRGVRYERAPSEETAHALDDVPLRTLGIARTLHVVLAIRAGSARLEHAMLVPGATILK